MRLCVFVVALMAISSPASGQLGVSVSGGLGLGANELYTWAGLYCISDRCNPVTLDGDHGRGPVVSVRLTNVGHRNLGYEAVVALASNPVESAMTVWEGDIFDPSVAERSEGGKTILALLRGLYRAKVGGGVEVLVGAGGGLGYFTGEGFTDAPGCCLILDPIGPRSLPVAVVGIGFTTDLSPRTSLRGDIEDYVVFGDAVPQSHYAPRASLVGQGTSRSPRHMVGVSLGLTVWLRGGPG